MHRFFYSLTKAACSLLFGTIAKIHRRGTQDLTSGPLILVGNHISHFDPPYLCAAFPKKVDFMAMRELFNIPLARRFFLANDVFPVNRHGVDTGALREAVARLKANRVICMFPEGGLRSGADSILEGKPLPPGGAILSQMADAPVRPFIIVGSDQLYRWQNIFRRPEIYIVLGPLFRLRQDLPAKQARKILNDELQSAILRLYHDLIREENLSDEILPKTAQQRWGLA